MKDPHADLKKFITQTVTHLEGQLRKDFQVVIAAAITDSENRLHNEYKIMRQQIMGKFDSVQDEFNGKFESFRKEFNAKVEDLQTEMRESFTAVGESFEEMKRGREQDQKYIDRSFVRHDREITILQKQITPLTNL